MHDLGGDRGDPHPASMRHGRRTTRGACGATRNWFAFSKRAVTDVALRAPISEEGVSDDAVDTLCRPSVTANTAEVSIDSRIFYVDQARLESDPHQNPSCEDHQRGLGREVQWDRNGARSRVSPRITWNPSWASCGYSPSPFRMMRCAFAFGAAMPLISSGAILPDEETPTVALEDVDDGAV